MLASTILHELAHAVVLSHRALLTKPGLSRGFLSDDTIDSLLTLGDQMGGPVQPWPLGEGMWRRYVLLLPLRLPPTYQALRISSTSSPGNRDTS